MIIGFSINDEGDHLSLGNIRHLRSDVIEVAQLEDGLDVGGKFRFGQDIPHGTFQDLFDDAALDLAVALEFDSGDPLLGGDPAPDVHLKLGENGAEALPALTLNVDSRQDFSRLDIDQPHIHADLFTEFSEAPRDGIGGAGLSAHCECQGVVNALPGGGGDDSSLFDKTEVFRFQKFRGHALIDRFPEGGGAFCAGAVDFKGKESDSFDVFCRHPPGRPEEDHYQKHCGVCKKPFFIHGGKSFRRADRSAGTCGRPATRCE